MNDFFVDDIEQKTVRNQLLTSNLYERFFAGRYNFADSDMALQKRGIDTVVRNKRSDVYIEEKIVRWKGRVYTAICLETKSCTLPGLDSPGWMHYGEADFLLYCMRTEGGGLDAYLIQFPHLKKWFWEKYDSWPLHVEKERNQTASRIVPLDEIRADVGVTEGFDAIAEVIEAAWPVRRVTVSHADRAAARKAIQAGKQFEFISGRWP
jgi:hypothetical protein